jgi:hypothetical protein
MLYFGWWERSWLNLSIRPLRPYGNQAILTYLSISLFIQERHRVKQLLATQEILFPNLFKSIQSALKPLMARKRTQMENKESSTDELSFLCRWPRFETLNGYIWCEMRYLYYMLKVSLFIFLLKNYYTYLLLKFSAIDVIFRLSYWKGLS